MRVLQINSVCGIRSTGRICTDIADVLEANGHECKIAYGRETVPEKYQKVSYRIGSDSQVRINGIKARILDNEGFNAKKQTRQLIEFIKDYKPDIIHLHNLHGYYINLEILLTYLAESQIPTVCTMHDCWAVTGHCAHFTTVKCERWETGCHDCPQKKGYPSSYLRDQSKANWEIKKALYGAVENMTVVTPSRWLADIMKESYLGDKRIEVIPNGIDTDVFKPTESDFRERHGLEDKKIVLGVASFWGKSKGIYDFIKLSEMLSDEYKIIMVGLDEKQKSELPENILGITRTNNTKELASIYTAADVFVNPTYQDNYPTTNLEARACGTPVITYRTGGSPESAGKDALVVDVGDLEGLVREIKVITDEHIDRKENQIEKLSRKFMAKSYVSLYEMMTSNIRGGVFCRLIIVAVQCPKIETGVSDKEVLAA